MIAACNCNCCQRNASYGINSPLRLIPDHVLKDTLAQRLFDKIKHGDEDHREWLAKELEEFFKATIAR